MPEGAPKPSDPAYYLPLLVLDGDGVRGQQVGIRVVDVQMSPLVT